MIFGQQGVLGNNGNFPPAKAIRLRKSTSGTLPGAEKLRLSQSPVALRFARRFAQLFAPEPSLACGQGHFYFAMRADFVGEALRARREGKLRIPQFAIARLCDAC